MIAPLQDDNGAIEPLLILPLPDELPPTPSESLQELLRLLGPQLAAASSPDPATPAIGGLISQLRHLTRDAQVLQNSARVQCSEAREDLDRSEEKVQAMLYELKKIREESERCQQYQPTWQDINLLPLEDFRRVVPEDKLGLLPCESDTLYQDSLAVLRLEYEVEEMQKRENLVAALTKERDDLIKAKREIKNKHEAVSVHIKDLYKSANAVSSKTRDVIKHAAAPARAT